MPVSVEIFARPWHKEAMGTPKVVDVTNWQWGDVTVITEADETTRAWTVTDNGILGGGIIFYVEIEMLDRNTYRREGGEWRSYTTEGDIESVTRIIAAQLDLVEQGAAACKSSRDN
jgi:hypothetical protein